MSKLFSIVLVISLHFSLAWAQVNTGTILGTVQADTVAVGETLTLASLTTTQRNALSAVNGMIVYNTTDAKFQGYQAGSWQNLI